MNSKGKLPERNWWYFAIRENLVNCKVGENISKPALQAFN
jgi:hypothetical protein